MPSLSKLADAAASYDPVLGLHYQLGCYVGSATIHPSPFEGWATFDLIWQRRPDKHRFAIARRVPLLPNRDPDPRTPLFYHADPTGDWVCWDLYDQGLIDRASRGTFPTRPPLPLWTGPTKESLTMRALTLYDHG